MYNQVQWLITHKRIIAIGIGLFFLAILLSQLFFKADSFTVTRLNMRSENQSVSIDGTVLRAYNGAFFFKKSLTDGETKTLGGGVKLPGITRALWAGDKGVLLNFDQSFIRTAAEDIANKENLSYEERAQSTWYFDFSDNTLHHIGSYPLHGTAHYFDGENGVLYYLEADEGLTLRALNTVTKQNRATPLSIQFDTINQLDKCHDSNRLCITGISLDSALHTSIYSIEDDGIAKKRFSVEGKLYSIPGSLYGLALERKDLIPLDEEDSMTEYKKGVLINIKTGERVEINRRLTPDNFLYTTYGDGDKLAVVSGDSNESYTTAKEMFWGSTTQSGQLTFDNGDTFDVGIIIDSTPTANSILLKTTEGEYGIFAQDEYIKADFSVEDFNTTINTIQDCMDNIKNTRTNHDKELRKITILLPDDQGFVSNISTVNRCLTKQVNVLYGYDISFTSYDPESGRITSY